MTHVPILAYHLVTDKFDLGFARTSLKQFRQQMAWLHRNAYRTLTLREAAQLTSTTASELSAGKCIVLTFDDAYASIRHAAEIMSRYGFVGTCFAISDYIGKLNGWDYQFFARKWQHADAHLLQSLVQAGWEVGSHSQQHRYLGRLSLRHLTADLQASKVRLAEITGAAIDTISYPFGYADQRICDVAEQVGYRYGVGLGGSIRKRKRLGRMCLPRLGVYRFDTLSSFAKKVNAFSGPTSFHFAMQQLVSIGSRATVLLKSLQAIKKDQS